MDYYRPGGPILFYQGAETAVLGCLEYYVMDAWAAELGAAVAQLEHRFFGASQPSTAPDPLERYAALTLDNVLDDSTRFVQWIKENNSTLDHSPVIVIGGSYGGWLSALLRLNHPETFYGSIAWAAPIKGMGPNSLNPERGNWYTWVSNVYSSYSAQAASKIKNALTFFEGYVRNGTNYERLAEALNLCDVPQNTSDLQKIFEHAILDAYTGNCQFSYAFSTSNATSGSEGSRFDQALNGTLDAIGPLEVINASLSVAYNGSCVDWNGSSSLMADIGGAYDYLACRYFPLQSDLIVNGTIFPTGELQDQATSCKQLYNLTIPTQQELSQQYRFTPEDLLKAKRLLFTFGSLDPASGFGPWELYTRISPDRNASHLIVVPGGAHTEDAYNPLLLTKPGVLQAQKFELEFMRAWLGIS